MPKWLRAMLFDKKQVALFVLIIFTLALTVSAYAQK
jgi:hypothetical protein